MSNQKHLIDVELEHALHGRFDEAWEISEHLERVLDRRTENYQRHAFNRGWCLLQRGEFQSGMQHLEFGRWLRTYGSPQVSRKPIWNPQFHLLRGKTVLLNSEGGYGDEIMHARFAKSLHDLGARVVLGCDEGLVPLFKRIVGADLVLEHSEARRQEHDYWIPAFSAAWLCGYTFETLPGAAYLKANEASVEMWKGMLQGKGMKIGIRWAGNPQFEHQQFRKFPLEPFFDIIANTDAQFYSFQRDADTVKNLPPNVTDLQHLLISWEDTAAAIANMDLVVTSCTAIAHLSAAMGKPTWVIVPILSYHCWAKAGRASPWYESVVLFRQKKFGEWDAPMAALRHELKEFAKNKVAITEAT